MDYQKFLANKLAADTPSGFDVESLHPSLISFQPAVTRWALRRGRAALFEDCGLGKTIQQLVWAENVGKYTSGDVLILAPLAVAKQTKREGDKFNIPVTICASQADVKPGINITNYEKLHKFTPAHFAGVVLDESSILKSYTGKFRTEIIESFGRTPYRLACTATPSPNDYMELGNHAEFLGVMSREEMLAMYFINDAGDTGTWRLKGHAQQKFWEWVCTWAVMIRKPSDLGFPDEGFTLPSLNIHEQIIRNGKPLVGNLFVTEAKTLSERRDARRQSMPERVASAAALANGNGEQWLIWCDLNDESAELTRAIPGAVEVKGADTDEHKEKSMLAFANGELRVLVSKPKIAGFGMNFQSCHNMAFVGLSDSYEAYYQAVRRCWRFGQKEEVNAHVITSELEGAVVANIKRKEKDAMEMAKNMVEHMKDISSTEIRGTSRSGATYETETKTGDGWELRLGDSCELVKEIPDNSIHYSIFSPPFSSLFTYSNSERDLGNCTSLDEFMTHFRFLSGELHRIIMPGRLLSFHCMNLPATITHDGYIGVKDFRGDLIRIFQEAGFVFHSEVCIWKDPLIQATRTKVLSLAHKQISKDSSRCAQGLPDYIITMRKKGANPEPIAHGRGFEEYHGEMPEPKDHKNNNASINKYSHHVWQRYASPVWFDIRQTYTLNSIKAEKDEKHCCPLQLDSIARCLDLWSNRGDTVFSPFLGVGSEGYQSISMGRKFLGFELKRAYYETAITNLLRAEKNKDQLPLFGGVKS